jgi:wyosine [tRNA(Phe)-imidazoG37] synthetase (radical SAM superfamily)
MEKAIATIDSVAGLEAGSSPPAGLAVSRRNKAGEIKFGPPRAFLGNRFVYAVISQRAHGLSLGVNVNPDKACDFDCPYCEVNRRTPARDQTVNLMVLANELENLLTLVRDGRMRDLPDFQNVPEELLALKGVTLSGDGEPTLSPQFEEIVEEVIHVRSKRAFPFFKIVLITNSSGLDRPEVRSGLRHLTLEDEIWAKLDAGAQRYMDEVNRPKGVTLQKILRNILLIARERPVVIQSLFPMVAGREPAPAEIEAYVARLRELKADGAKISSVQVYSAHRAPNRSDCSHLPLKCLSRIAQCVREVTGLPAEVF